MGWLSEPVDAPFPESHALQLAQKGDVAVPNPSAGSLVAESVASGWGPVVLGGRCRGPGRGRGKEDVLEKPL